MKEHDYFIYPIFLRYSISEYQRTWEMKNYKWRLCRDYLNVAHIFKTNHVFGQVGVRRMEHVLYFWYELYFINKVSKHRFQELGQCVLLWFQFPFSFHIPRHKISLNKTNQILYSRRITAVKNNLYLITDKMNMKYKLNNHLNYS